MLLEWKTRDLTHLFFFGYLEYTIDIHQQHKLFHL
jgi:hypothetical protein